MRTTSSASRTGPTRRSVARSKRYGKLLLALRLIFARAWLSGGGLQALFRQQDLATKDEELQRGTKLWVDGHGEVSLRATQPSTLNVAHNRSCSGELRQLRAAHDGLERPHGAGRVQRLVEGGRLQAHLLRCVVIVSKLFIRHSDPVQTRD